MGQIRTCLWLLLASVVAGEYGWKPKQEYTFRVEGRSLSGLEYEHQQYAGVHYRGILKVQVQSSTLLVMKLQNMTYTKIHEEMPSGWWSEIAAENFLDFPITKNTFAVKMDRGVVESVSVPKDLDDWEVNFLQGLVSQLQLDLSGTNVLPESRGNVDHGEGRDERMFRVMEDSVLGRCEVVYELVQISPTLRDSWTAADTDVLNTDLCGSKSYWEITKTINFDKCSKRAEYHFGLPSKNCVPGSNTCGDYWKRSSVTRAQGCGERKDLLLLSSVRSSRILANLHLHNASAAAVNSFLNITIISMKPATAAFSAPKQPSLSNTLFYKHSVSKGMNLKNAACDGDSEHSSSETGNKQKSHSRIKRGNSKMDSKLSKKTPIRLKPSAKKTTEKAFSSHSSDEDSPWKLPRLDADHAPFLPFSPFTLARRELAYGKLNMADKLKEIIGGLARAIELSEFTPEEFSLEKINLAIEISRTMSLQELKIALEGVMDNSNGNSAVLTERKLYRDVIAMSGTTPSFQMIKSWIENKKLKGEEAAEVLASLPAHLMTPNQDLLKRFFDLVRSSAVLEDQQVKISAVLSFSNLIRAACINNNTQHSRYSMEMFVSANCSAQDAAKYVSWISQQLDSDKPLTKVYITALGNTGASLALKPLYSIAQDTKSSTIERGMAVYAMKHQVFKNPRYAIRLLLSLFDDTSAPTSVRIAAVSLMFYAQPPTEIWQRIAVSTWYDPSLAVATFVRSSLASLASIQDSNYIEVSKKAAAALPLSKPFPRTLHKPMNLVQTSVSGQLQEVISEQLSWLPGPEGANIYYRNTQRWAGFSRVNFEGEMWLTNPDNFFMVLKELIYSDEDIAANRPMIKSLPRSTKWLRENLKISQRSNEKWEGVLHFNINKLRERMFVFDNKIYDELLKAGRKLVEQYKSGKPFHYQKMDRTSMVMSTTTEMGLPVYMQINAPWAVRTLGETKISNAVTELRVNASLMYTSELVACLKLFSAWDNMIHVSAWHATNYVQLPALRLQAQLDAGHKEVEFAVSPLEQPPSLRLAHYSSRAFTAQNGAHKLTPISLAESLLMVQARPELEMSMALPLGASLRIRGSVPLRQPVVVLGFPVLSTAMEEFTANLVLAQMPPITLTFNLGRAIVENGTINMIFLPGNNSTQNAAEPTTESTTESTTEAVTEAVTEAATEATTAEDGGDTSTLTITSTEAAISTEPHTEEMVRISVAGVERNNGFRAGNINPFNDEDEEAIYTNILTQALKGIYNGRGYVVGMNVRVHAEEPRSYSAYWTYASDVLRKHHRFGLFGQQAQHNTVMAFTAVADLPSAPLLDITDIMNTPVQAEILADFNIKTESQNLQLTLQGTGTRSERKLYTLRQSRLFNSCQQKNDNMQLECRRIADEIAKFDVFNISLQFNDGMKQAFMEPAAVSYSMMKSYLIPYFGGSRLAQGSDGSSNTVKLMLVLAANKQSVDLDINSSEENIEFHDVPISPALAGLLQYSPENSMLPGLLQSGYCGVSLNQVLTFDEVAFPYNLTDCWHVVAKDASGKSRFVILARNKEQQLEVEVNVDNYKVINLKSGPELSVNQKPMSMEKDEVLIVTDRVGTLLVEAYQGSDASYRINLPAHGIGLLYNNQTLLLQAGEGTRGRLVGLCGDNDRERVAEFRNPAGKLERTPFAFAASYAVKDGDCKEMPRLRGV